MNKSYDLDPFNDGSLLTKYLFEGDTNDLTGVYDAIGEYVTYNKYGSVVFNGYNSKVYSDSFFPLLVSEGYSFSVVVSDCSSGSIFQSRTTGRGSNLDFRVGVLSIYDGDTTSIEYTSEPRKEVRYTVVVGVNSSDIKLYKGAVLLGVITDRTLTNPQTELHIGFRELDTGSSSEFLDGNIHCLEVYKKPISAIEIASLVESDGYEVDYNYFLGGILFNPTWANKETRSQANPQPDSLQTLKQTLEQKLLGKSGNYNSMMNQQGEQRKSGYYQSTVTVSDVPKPNTRVLCFTNDGQLLDETYSNESGVYRFDHLLMENKYLFVAQYNNGNPKVAPDYLAAASDWQSPTPYGS